MRVGIMLRALTEKGGVGVYAWNITRELLKRAGSHRYVLYHQVESTMGQFGRSDNVTEKLLDSTNKAYWDQVLVPRECRRDQIEVLFHPKFTVPIFSPCPSVMVLHGAGWFIDEHKHYWNRVDRTYLNLVMPQYCRKASAILAVSEVTTQVFTKKFGLPKGKVRTVYLAPARGFRRIEDSSTLSEVRSRYELPERFIFTLSKYPGGERKNIDGILRSFSRIHSQVPHKLVVGGKDCDNYRKIFNVPDDEWGADVIFPGYIAQEDLPAVYSLADVFLYPSNMEAFPIPVTEAMSCGAPVVTSNQNGLEEIAGDAAIRIDDPKDDSAIAAALTRVLNDDALRQDLRKRGIDRAKRFTWDRCGQQTLEVLERAATGQEGAKPASSKPLPEGQ